MEKKMESIPEIFGSMVFNERVMKAMLDANIYRSLKKTIDEGAPLDISVANPVANAMKNWAISKGATHFTHWFQPMTGLTAEKHDSFISPSPDGGIIMDFSGKELIHGEPDASSFPSGGLRATFEARGYTAWDPTSFAFIKGKTLCIPTAFCSYDGSVLDKKTPLLRSMEALNAQALRILRLFGDKTTKRVVPCAGPEQEYFLIDKELFGKRKDLVFTGRTLFGAKPPKGQELDDHYFGTIKPRVAEFMADLNVELWKAGIFAKTEHNEVAPSQHEMAPIYATANVATDHNQLTMELMQKVALRHGLVCLLHEKPFAGVNGSGKHNNWSLATNGGENLLTPGETPAQNARFLVFLCAIIQAVDTYQDLLRSSVATAGNDHRLGANEAPPAIVSVFLGEELTGVLDAIENDTSFGGVKKTEMMFGVPALPKFLRDTTDRNRTSPFAFTGNKFEFRMVGSSNSIACANIMLNAAVAEVLSEYADVLEKADDFAAALKALLKKAVGEHKRILFNGNGYDDAWIREATEKRGLSNLKTTPDCMPRSLDEKNISMLVKQKVFSREELTSRCEIMLENYVKTVLIEANTMIEMACREILPAIEKYTEKLAETACVKQSVCPKAVSSFEKETIEKLSDLTERGDRAALELEKAVGAVEAIEDIFEKSYAVRDNILGKMADLRAACDDAERLTAREYWPFPTYSDLLFGLI